MRALIAVALMPAGLIAQAAPADELLVRGQERVIETIKHLRRYTCTQTVDRTEFRQIQPHLQPSSCDQILADRKNGLSQLERIWTDRLRLEVEVTDSGGEIYSWPGAERIASDRIQDFSGAGVIGTGAFGPFLIDIFANRGVKFWRLEEAVMNGRSLRPYRYIVPLSSSHLKVVAGGDPRVVPIEGRFWLDSESAELSSLLVQVGELSRTTGNCEASTTVEFKRMKLASGEYLLPVKSVLRAVRRDAAEQENVTTYSACHEFQGQSVIHFGVGSDPVLAAAPKTASASAKASVFPPGVRVKISIDGGIDTSVAAAGDPITARIRHNETRPRKRVIPEAGAPARCRVTGLEHNFGEVPEYGLSLACESIQLNGAWIPFAATRDEPADLLGHRQINLTRTGGVTHTVTRGRRPTARGGGTFVFPSSEPRYLVAPFTSQWISVVPPKGRP